MPGRHITDQQTRLFMTLRQTQPLPVAAAKAGLSQATGYHLIGRLPAAQGLLHRAIPADRASATGADLR
jgi:cyanate permease